MDCLADPIENPKMKKTFLDNHKIHLKTQLISIPIKKKVKKYLKIQLICNKRITILTIKKICGNIKIIKRLHL